MEVTPPHPIVVDHVRNDYHHKRLIRSEMSKHVSNSEPDGEGRSNPLKLPLKFRDAVRGLLRTKPPPREEPNAEDDERPE